MKKQDENIQKGFRRKSVDFCRSVSHKGSAYNEFCLKWKILTTHLLWCTSIQMKKKIVTWKFQHCQSFKYLVMIYDVIRALIKYAEYK